MTEARGEFCEAAQRLLDHCGVDATSHFVDVPSIAGEAHVLACGEGPPVVLLNGIGTPGAMWAPLLAELGGLRLLVVDLPGYGLTDTAPGLFEAMPRSAVRFLEEALDALALERPVFLGSSMGALWASWLALERPDRVRALVHVGCPALALGTSAPLPMRALSVRPLGRLLTRLQPPSRRQVEQVGRMVGEDPLPPLLVDLLVATERLPGFRDAFLANLHALLRLRGARPARALTADQLARIPHPTLLVWGRDDPFGSPEVGERMAAALPDAALRVVEGGHAPWVHHADQVARPVREFL